MQSVRITTNNVVKVCQCLVAGLWFSLGIPVSSTNKTDHHDIAEILLIVVLNTITLTLYFTFVEYDFLNDITFLQTAVKITSSTTLPEADRKQYFDRICDEAKKPIGL